MAGSASSDSDNRGQILSRQESNRSEADRLYEKAAAALSTNDGASALTLLKSSLAIDPDHVASLTLMAQLAHATGAIGSAISLMKQAVSLDPDNAKIQFTYGALLQSQNRLDDALEPLTRSLSLDPKLAEAAVTLGNLYRSKGQWSNAARYYERALKERPDLSEVETNLGAVRLSQGLQEAAITHHQRAVAGKPDFDLAHHNLLLSLHYSDKADTDEIFAKHLEWGRPVEASVEPIVPTAKADDSERPLRIGFVSPDFNNHPVSQFFLPYLTGRGESGNTAILYSASDKKDQITKRLLDLSDEFKQVDRVDDAGLAAMIRDDEVDILVDLCGHTAGSRLKVFAYQPAPVQVTWLGYPDTTGLSRMTYRLTDAIADPPGMSDDLATESLYRLSSGFLCYTPPQDAPEVAIKPPHVRPIVFGSFNNLSKVTDRAIRLWSQILVRVPDSRLLLKAKSLDDDATCARLAACFADQGIAADRIDIRRHTTGMEAHYATYNEVDIALDTFPYNGTTTTCDALWMGVPVVCSRGDRHCARVSASILHRLGLQNWIADSPEDYVDVAVRAALDRAMLGTMQNSLRPLMSASVLVNASAFAEELDTAFRVMWRQSCSQ